MALTVHSETLVNYMLPKLTVLTLGSVGIMGVWLVGTGSSEIGNQRADALAIYAYPRTATISMQESLINIAGSPLHCV